MSTRQLHPTRERSTPEEWPSGRETWPFSYRPRTNRRMGLPLGKGVSSTAVSRRGSSSGSPDRAASSGRASSSKVVKAAKGLPDRDRMGLPPYRENMAGEPGFSLSFQNTRSAPSRGRAWWKMSLSPTDTPPVVISRSQVSSIRAMASATARGSSPASCPVTFSTPSSRRRASSRGRLAP